MYILNISVGKINDRFASRLTHILNVDASLKQSLDIKSHIIISKDEFIKHNNEWAESSNSEIFAIILNDIAIGMISLSHKSREEKKAQIGYWIESKHWSKGFTGEAFSIILDYARAE